MGAERLSELERELLGLCALSPETTTLHEEMLESARERGVVEAALKRLVEQGLMRTYRGVYAGKQLSRDGTRAFDRVYEDDWWEVTAAGRQAAHAN